MIFKILAFIFGAAIGSFLNVYIYRTCKNEEHQTKENIFFPARSYCPHCSHLIAWYDNIPLLSFIFLKAKCRHCKQKISFQYFLVELLTGILTLAMFIFYVEQQQNYFLFFISLLLTYSMIAISFIDLKVYIIPDAISLGGIGVGIVLSFIYPQLHDKILFWNLPIHLNSILASLIGVIMGGGILLLVGIIGEKIFKKEAMGGGDVKLLAMMGAFLGWQGVLLIVLIASLIGTFISLILVFLKRKKISEHIPFGPFLAIACLIVMYFKKEILALFM